MSRFRFSFLVLVALALGPQICRAQQPVSLDQIPLAPPALVGGLENAGGQLRINLTNTDSTRAFRGTAQVSLGNSSQQAAAAQLALALAPQETRLFPLSALAVSGDQYTLMIFDQAGALVFSKTAPVKRLLEGAPAASSPAVAGAAPPTDTAPLSSESEVKVEPRLAGGERENDPFVLAFEVSSPKPITNASFNVSAKGFEQRQPVTVRGRANVEFKLPDELDDRKISFTLTEAGGRVLARGEADLDQLMLDDHVSVGEVKLDRPAYAPGESAHLVLSLQGQAQHGYRLEVTAKDGRGNIVFRDTRRGKNENGSSFQEYALPLPREAVGPVIFEFKVYHAETGMLFDSGEREIPLQAPGGATRPIP